jgi:hypothetical protein
MRLMVDDEASLLSPLEALFWVTIASEVMIE